MWRCEQDMAVYLYGRHYDGLEVLHGFERLSDEKGLDNSPSL